MGVRKKYRILNLRSYESDKKQLLALLCQKFNACCSWKALLDSLKSFKSLKSLLSLVTSFQSSFVASSRFFEESFSINNDTTLKQRQLMELIKLQSQLLRCKTFTSMKNFLQTFQSQLKKKIESF
jgi:hypothetical protein